MADNEASNIQVLKEAISLLPPRRQKSFLRRLEKEGPTVSLANSIADTLEKQADDFERQARVAQRLANLAQRIASWSEEKARVDEAVADEKRAKIQK